jgi:hypothetical protein
MVVIHLSIISWMLLIVFWCADLAAGLEELVQLQTVYNKTSLYPRVQYSVAPEQWTSAMMVCVWSTFVGATLTSEHAVLPIAPVCFQHPVGVMPVDTDVHGAYLVSAAIVRRGAGLINEESRLSAITDLAVSVENMNIKKLSMPTQLMRDNLLKIDPSKEDVLATPADEAVRQALLIPTQDPYKLRLSHKVQQYMEPCNPGYCSNQLNELQLNARWSQVTC